VFCSGGGGSCGGEDSGSGDEGAAGGEPVRLRENGRRGDRRNSLTTFVLLTDLAGNECRALLCFEEALAL